ncbi:MAG: hypothetical protein H0X35_15605, partial [Pseudonocardiales bacterium]|nr:hypothetical protein [Pseudonocardiales bacterium]
LDTMLHAGVLSPADRETAATVAWATVHGLSQLLLGPLREIPASHREALIDGCLDLLSRGLIVRPPTNP